MGLDTAQQRHKNDQPRGTYVRERKTGGNGLKYTKHAPTIPRTPFH